MTNSLFHLGLNFLGVMAISCKNINIQSQPPLQTEFPVFWEFLRIPRNSQKFPIMQMSLANWIPSFLGIPRNTWEFLGIPRKSQKFPTMQINSDLKSLKLLGISVKGRLQFCEDLESLGIPRNSQLYKLPII